MIGTNDFIVEDGILNRYDGASGDVVIPDGVTSIGSGAFSWHHYITSVIIPNSVTSIQDYAFHYCCNLTNIMFPNSITSIGRYAFCGCISLATITIPHRARSIGRGAFFGCYDLASVTIPSSVTNIEAGAFCDCVNLTSNNPSLRFKATNGEMRCRGFQYSLGKWFEIDGEVKLCSRGFHSCKNPLDIFNYYSGEIGKDVRLWLVETDGETEENDRDSKVVSKCIRFIKELTISELADYTRKEKQ